MNYCSLKSLQLVLGIASILFKEKQMGVMRVYGIMPAPKALFIISKLIVFLVSDLVFAALLTLLNVKYPDATHILPRVLLQTGILSLIMVLVGMGCSLLINDFKQFSLAYLVVALFISAPVFFRKYFSTKQLDFMASVLSSLYGNEKCVF